jgi:hypothetical protein
LCAPLWHVSICISVKIKGLLTPSWIKAYDVLSLDLVWLFRWLEDDAMRTWLRPTMA